MYKTIFIAGINRSGGSLLARLFDGHKNLASYPLEIPFLHDNSFFKIFENYAGIPMTVPSKFDGNVSSISKHLYSGGYSRDPLPNKDKIYDSLSTHNLLDVPIKKPVIEAKWGKEKSDILGVRRNYLEKSFYDNVQTNFNYKIFIEKFNEYSSKADNWETLHNARHKAYFESWDNGENINNNTSHIVMHDSGGLYLTNIDDFFRIYKDSRVIVPIRDIFGYIASEKIRLARRFFGARRFNRPQVPWFLIKKFSSYDLKAKIRSWTCSVTRANLLQRKFGVNKNLLIYNNERLVQNPELVMKAFAENIGIEFDNILLKTTIGKRNWGGNSHYGKSEGINKSAQTNYKKVLDLNEIKIIEDSVGKLREKIILSKEPFLDLTQFEENLFEDFNYQKKYFNDKEKITLYYSLVNTGGRRTLVTKPTYLTIIAYLFSIFVRIYHIPRMLKLKFFPGLGKQNYT